MRAAFIEKHCPADEVESSLVDEMLVANWRLQRMWAAGSSLFLRKIQARSNRNLRSAGGTRSRRTLRPKTPPRSTANRTQSYKRTPRAQTDNRRTANAGLRPPNLRN
jgi:hypothetical protein